MMNHWQQYNQWEEVLEPSHKFFIIMILQNIKKK